MEQAFQRDLVSPDLDDVFECLVEEDHHSEEADESEEVQQLEKDLILKEKKIKKLTTKNNNLPKFLIRIFMKVAYDYAENKGIKEFDEC